MLRQKTTKKVTSRSHVVSECLKKKKTWESVMDAEAGGFPGFPLFIGSLGQSM